MAEPDSTWSNDSAEFASEQLEWRGRSTNRSPPNTLVAAADEGGSLVRLIALAVTTMLTIGSLLLFAPVVLAQADAALSSDNEVSLPEGTNATIDLVTSTASVYRAVDFVAEPSNAIPHDASELRNNYSLSDHSDQERYPGFNDCDSWRNLVDDGWTATYGLSGRVTGDEGIELIDAVTSYWQSLGYAVGELTLDQGASTYTRLWIETEFSRIQLTIDPRRGQVTIRGTTDCLPPG